MNSLLLEKENSDPNSIFLLIENSDFIRYEVFDRSLIRKEKIGLGLEMMKSHLMEVEFFMHNGPEKEFLKKQFSSYEDDYNFLIVLKNEFSNLIEINELNQKEHINKLSKLKNEILTLNEEIEKENQGIKKIELEISRIDNEIEKSRISMNDTIKDCKAKDLIKLCLDLKIKKDCYQIHIVKTISSLLTNNINISKSQIADKVQNCNNFIKEMERFEIADFNKLQIVNIQSTTKFLIEIINSKDMEKKDIINKNKYQHLLHFASWIYQTCDYLLKIEDKNNSLKEIKRKENYVSVIQLILNDFNNYNADNFLNCFENMKEELEKVLDFTEIISTFIDKEINSINNILSVIQSENEKFIRELNSEILYSMKQIFRSSKNIFDHSMKQSINNREKDKDFGILTSSLITSQSCTKCIIF